MIEIILKNQINAPIEKCFDLSLDVDFHKLSMKNTNEQAISGRLNGLCELNDEITWKAKHFGITQYLSVKITQFDKPVYFEDTMTNGAFKRMRHEHHFIKLNDTQTEMVDKFYYETPYGIVGKIFDLIILKKYMTNLLSQRNKMLKEVAENSKAFS